MRKTILAAVLVLAPVSGGLAMAGCSSNWWQQWQSNPEAQVQSFEQTAQIVLDNVQVAWSFVQPFLPAAQATQITQQFEKGMAAVNHAMQVLNDAVQAAIAAKQPTPDFTGLMQDVSNAIGQILAIVDLYKSAVPADAGTVPTVTDLDSGVMVSATRTVPGLDAAHAGANTLKRYTAH